MLSECPEPQVLLDLPSELYHAERRLSASGVFTLSEHPPPRRFWFHSPWNPEYAAVNGKAFDIGTATHLAVLEPHLLKDRVVNVPFSTYQTKEARELRDQAWAAHRTPLKIDETETVANLSRAIFADPVAAPYFRGGSAEVSIFWEWAGISCKARPDYWSKDRLTVVDLKTAMTCDKDAIARKAKSEGWHVRDAWYREAVAAATGNPPEHYLFAVIEKPPPHLIQVFELSERAIEWGRKIIQRGMEIFRACSETDQWPSYEGIERLDLPAWAEFQLADRQENGDLGAFRSAGEILRSMDWLRP